MEWSGRAGLHRGQRCVMARFELLALADVSGRLTAFVAASCCMRPAAPAAVEPPHAHLRRRCDHSARVRSDADHAAGEGGSGAHQRHAAHHVGGLGGGVARAQRGPHGGRGRGADARGAQGQRATLPPGDPRFAPAPRPGARRWTPAQPPLLRSDPPAAPPPSARSPDRSAGRSIDRLAKDARACQSRIAPPSHCAHFVFLCPP